MSKGLTCVQYTSYGDFFEHVGKNKVFILSKEAAKKAWQSEVCANSSSYFDLPDDCWIVVEQLNLIGRWMDAYNNDDNAIVERLLRNSVNWFDTEYIKFFVNHETVFRVKWKDFLCFWDEFIAVGDDCPIVIPESDLANEALIFRPIGDIQKIG